MRRTISIAMLAVSILLLTPSAAHAAKGGGGDRGGGPKGSGDTSGVTLDLQLVYDGDADGAPDHGDTVTFAFEQDATAEPHLDLVCRQNGTVVYSATTGYFESYPWPWTKNMSLASSAWTEGPADCEADLYYYGRRKPVTIGSLAFTAGA